MKLTELKEAGRAAECLRGANYLHRELGEKDQWGYASRAEATFTLENSRHHVSEYVFELTPSLARQLIELIEENSMNSLSELGVEG